MDDSLKGAKGTDLKSENIEHQSNNGMMPSDWFPLEDEVKLSKEDKESGLESFLYKARDTAAEAIENLFEGLGIDEKFYGHVKNMPVGLEDEEEYAGMSRPGQYGIILGRKSEDIVDYTSGTKGEAELNRTQNSLAKTMAHEMIHSIQTVPPQTDYDQFEFLGHNIMNLEGFEEGMAEALANISIGMLKTKSTLKDEALKLEDYCAKRGDVPATQMAARVIRKVNPEFLRWYLTCAQTSEYKRDKVREIFGPRRFLTDMVVLDDYECGRNRDERKKDLTVQTVTKIIDQSAA